MKDRLLLFGSPTVEYGGESVALPFERRTQLLALLALKRSWIGRAELATMLWPDLETERAYRNLRKILHRVQLLPWARNLEVRSGGVRFEAETDVSAFESALREQRIADALPMRRGELLAGFEDDQSEAWSNWLNFERDRLRLAWRDAALSRIATDIDTAEAIELSTRLLEADPLDEIALRAHMACLARGGMSAQARQAYRDFADRLAEDLGLVPGAELRALHDSLGATVTATRLEAPPDAIGDDSFIGRSVELQGIGAALARHECRLLSLIGPGGVGKSRLAMQAIREFGPGFSDSAAFVPLEDLSSLSELGGRLARELGIELVGRDEPLAQVIAFLGQRHMLIVLDNFEHLTDDASLLSQLLRECARLKIIVTSRTRLEIPGEWVSHVEGLPWPDIEDQDRFEAFDAVRLFVHAARRVQPELVPALEAAAIVDICRQVEGLPLALELAAAWTRVLSCDAIAAELRHGSELLRAVDAARPARQASIDVVLDQSWRLLSPIERDALSRLSVFRGGFSADAARTIANASLPVLGALADRSLLRKDGARLFMHPLVQQWAALRLGEGTGRESAVRAHAQFFHRLLAQSRRAVEDGDRDALQRVDNEFENCRAAWSWSVANGGIDALTKSTLTLMHFCDHRGRFEEGLALLRDALESQAVQTDPGLAPLLLGAAASLEYRLDHYGAAEAAASGALAASRPVDRDTKFRCFNVLGSCSHRLGRPADAKGYFLRALKQAQANADAHNAAGMLDNLALVETTMGHRENAQRLSIQSLVEHRRLGDFAGEALCLNNLAVQYLDRREYESARVHLRQGLALCERHGLVSTRALILLNLVDLAIKTGDYRSAEADARPAVEIAEATGNRLVLCMLKLHLAELDLQRGDLPTARSDLGSALGIAIALGGPDPLLEGVLCFAEILAAQGQMDCARLVLSFATEHPAMPAQRLEEKRARLTQWPECAGAAPAWPGLELSELVNRIVVETEVAHAPLIAALRGAH